MRRVLVFLPLAVLACALPAGAQPAGPPQKAAAGVRTVEIQVGDTMRFSPASIDAQRGEALRLVLRDTGTMPKQAMAHDFVLLKPGADPKKFADASATARATGFIAPDLKDQVLASTTLVGPGETAEATFTAPAKPGHYVFICSFPGHYAVGMKGTLNVK